ncbi:cytochrome P450 [Imleria badia]|nr:cytochrome P450 [Imleria badia]
MFLLERFWFPAIASITCFAIWNLCQFVYRQLTSPLRHLRGPKSTSLIYGNMGDIRGTERPKLYGKWAREYGNTMKYNGFFNRDQLFTLDTRAINHVLTHSNDYQKKATTRYDLAQLFGEGKHVYSLLRAPSTVNRLAFISSFTRHANSSIRSDNPAFGPAQIRALTDIFLDKAVELRGLWLSEIAKQSAATSTGARIDVVPWLSRMTLDVIGLAGFNYDFKALSADGKPNELNEAFSTMFSASQRLSVLPILQAWIPPLRLIPTERTRQVRAAQRTMTRIGKELLINAKAAARASATEKGEIEKNSLHGRDLLSLLVKANMATDIPESQRLSDEDVLAQVPTFFIAGHETTSTAVTWALYAMTQVPDVQTKLREELLTVETDTPSMDDLMALPYLDTVVRETLRVYPPVPATERIATKDDVLSFRKPFTDKHGAVHDSIRVSKGDAITIPIMAMNLSTELWGPDAQEFKPERWTCIPEGASHVPGVWGHLLTFIGGFRGCIGYRFSLVETKAILFILVRTFEFALAVPASEIGSKTAIVQRPVLRSDPTNKAQLPLLVRPYQTI